ncbi:glycosyltransferase [Nostocoides vanveenii]|uniref:Erythromycin biosynthesis protein CIII-like C-terminal domain-containing protein n=1 Tax=Nostocoides vanveenii TaxID=330835 RepID=A0ABN2K394_9MICO
MAGRPGPRAYLTLGTVAFGAVDTLRRSLPESAEVCGQVLVAAGPKADLSALGTLPDNVRVERSVHQPSVLDDVHVAIQHGGTGTLLACLAVGVPQVVTPQGGHQFMNADQLARLDLGVVVHNDAPAGSVAAAVRRALSNEPLHARVAAICAEIAGMPSPDDVIETLTHR